MCDKMATFAYILKIVEKIFGFQILDLKDHFSAYLTYISS